MAIALTDPAEDLRQLVERRATCPFVGSAVMDGTLAFQGPADAPVAAIGAVRALGDTGGGRLGSVLAFFARANHGFGAGSDGRLTSPLPVTLFSLDIPGSQGSHPGHSGILEGDPATVASGRFGAESYRRLTDRAQEGRVTRSQVAAFIAENLRRDPDARVSGLRVICRMAARLAFAIWKAVENGARQAIGPRGGADWRSFDRALGRFLGCNNLLGSSGEFGLLFAFLAGSPHTATIGGQPALGVYDLDDLFVRRRLPEGWRDWRKTARSWAWNTLCLAASAFGQYSRLARADRAGR